jgi:hypothetical protein
MGIFPLLKFMRFYKVVARKDPHKQGEVLHIKQRKRDKIHERQRMKGPKLEIFGSRIFTQIRPVWVGDLGTRPKIPNFDGLGLKIGVSYF